MHQFWVNCIMGLQIAMVVRKQVHDCHHDKHSLPKCLWRRVRNSSSNLFETPCTMHMFINNKVNASMVDLEQKTKASKLLVSKLLDSRCHQHQVPPLLLPSHGPLLPWIGHSCCFRFMPSSTTYCLICCDALVDATHFSLELSISPRPFHTMNNGCFPL